MKNELSPQEYIAIEKFANELKGCFAQYQKNHPDNLSDMVLNYVIQVINIHLELAELKFERYAFNMAEQFEQKKP